MTGAQIVVDRTDATQREDAGPFGWIFPAGALFFGLILLAALLSAVSMPLVHDTPLMDYIVFLIHNGMAPYRDIVDMNMPGVYLVQMAQTHLFGSGGPGIVTWDFLTIGIVIWASQHITGPGHRAAGIIGGCGAALLHLSSGAWDLGQRDWDIAMLLLLACALLVEFRRSGSFRWVFVAFLAAGVAASIKPTGLLFPVAALALLIYEGRTITGRTRRILAYAVAGASLPAAIVIAFLVSHHALRAFIWTLTNVVPYSSSLGRLRMGVLAWHSPSLPERLLLIVSVVCAGLCILQRPWRSTERVFVTLGVGCGISTYLLQAKGWPYQRSVIFVFLFLWVVMVLEKVLDARPKWARIMASLLILPIAALPVLLLALERVSQYPVDTMESLQRDLIAMGGADLSGHVQCLDMAGASCINVLFRLHLVQSTGLIYDSYVFPERDAPVTEAIQNRFLSKISAAPPQVIVLSEQIWPGDRLGYYELGRWPAFQSFLQDRYLLERQYSTPSKRIAGYRIYALRQSH